MADRNTHAIGRLIYFAQLLPHARDEAERREFLAECQTALGVLEAEQREPLPPHVSRDLWPAQGPRTTIEAGAGFAPGELRRPDACDPAEDGAERVMQAAESWWGRQ
jgi:hypothetical protein